VYGCRPNNASDFEEFSEIWEQLKVKSCTSLSLQVEMPEYDFSMNIPQRYYLETNKSTIFISKVYERILTISLGEAIATLFKLPHIAMRIDKVLTESGDEAFLDDLFASTWKIPELPREWLDGLVNSPDMGEATIEEDMRMEDIEVEDVIEGIHSAEPARAFMSPPPSLEIQVQNVVQSQEFRKLICSMAESFNSMMPDEIARRLPSRPFCGYLKEDVNLRPISEDVITEYDNELERTTPFSIELTIERIEDNEKSVQSGIIGEYFVHPGSYFTDADISTPQPLGHRF
jgi:hypothetical protein